MKVPVWDMSWVDPCRPRAGKVGELCKCFCRCFRMLLPDDGTNSCEKRNHYRPIEERNFISNAALESLRSWKPMLKTTGRRTRSLLRWHSRPNQILMTFPFNTDAMWCNTFGCQGECIVPVAQSQAGSHKLGYVWTTLGSTPHKRIRKRNPRHPTELVTDRLQTYHILQCGDQCVW